ncbi:bifunctional sugar-1-phosphate nucleotidylyltransferase/acetyltransferase [Chloroflexota bacterium]
MKAVILAAGEGSRMRPLTHTRPKVMLPIANKPILEHLLVEIMKAGIKEFIFIVGYHDEQIRNYFTNGDKWGTTINYTTQRKQLGTADALRMIEDQVDDNFLLINGDIIIDQKDVRTLMNMNGNAISVLEVEDTQDLGSVVLDAGKVVCIHEKIEKPPSNMANVGLYLFTPDIFAATSQISQSPRGEFEITDCLQLLIDQGHCLSYQAIDYWINLSYPWDLLQANEAMLTRISDKNLGEIEDNVIIKGAVSIEKGTIVRSGSYIIGPVIIGQNCSIGPNCHIRPYTSISNDCHIGNAVEIKNSIIMSGSKIPHHNYVGDSIIGERCNLGAGTKIANLRLDGQDIWVSGKNTKRRKLGAIIGDTVETGINTSINVGTVIGNNTNIGPGAIVNGLIASDSNIF